MMRFLRQWYLPMSLISTVVTYFYIDGLRNQVAYCERMRKDDAQDLESAEKMSEESQQEAERCIDSCNEFVHEMVNRHDQMMRAVYKQ